MSTTEGGRQAAVRLPPLLEQKRARTSSKRSDRMRPRDGGGQRSCYFLARQHRCSVARMRNITFRDWCRISKMGTRGGSAHCSRGIRSPDAQVPVIPTTQASRGQMGGSRVWNAVHGERDAPNRDGHTCPPRVCWRASMSWDSRGAWLPRRTVKTVGASRASWRTWRFCNFPPTYVRSIQIEWLRVLSMLTRTLITSLSR